MFCCTNTKQFNTKHGESLKMFSMLYVSDHNAVHHFGLNHWVYNNNDYFSP